MHTSYTLLVAYLVETPSKQNEKQNENKSNRITEKIAHTPDMTGNALNMARATRTTVKLEIMCIRNQHTKQHDEMFRIVIGICNACCRLNSCDICELIHILTCVSLLVYPKMRFVLTQCMPNDSGPCEHRAQ